MKINLEKKSKFWIGLFLIAMSSIYVMVSWGSADWVQWIAVVWGFFLAGFLYIEAGVTEYFRQKRYQSIGVDDVVIWITLISATVLLINSVVLLNIISETSLPAWLVTFLRSNATIFGVVSGILGVFYTLTGKLRF